MTNRFTISFVNDFPFYDSNNLSPGYGWNPTIERLHPRGKIGKMFCESVPIARDRDKTINDVGRSEKIARKFDDSTDELNRLMTRVVMSERPLINTDSEYDCDLGINLVLSDDKALTTGWHSSTVSNIHAVVAIPTFNERTLVLGFIRDIILELSIANSPPIRSALHLWSGIDNTHHARIPLDVLFAKKVDYLRTWLGSESKITNHIYHDAEYVAFSSFVRDSYSPEGSAKKVIDFWDEFIMDLLSDIRPSAHEIAKSLVSWPYLGGQLNISTITNKIEKYAKKGINYLIITTAEKVRDKLLIDRYEVIQPDDLLTKTYQDVKSTNNKNQEKIHAIKFYYSW